MKKNNLKNFFCILFSNLLIFSSLCLGANYYIEHNIKKFGNFLSDSGIMVRNNKNLKINLQEYDIEETKVEYADLAKEFCLEERKEFGLDKEYTKNPILVFGCSYAYGSGLKQEETFPYLLSELTQRPVLNFSRCSKHLLYSIDQFYDYNKDLSAKKMPLPNPDYVIYIYMHDHINRYLRIANIYEYYDILFPNQLSIITKIPLTRFICSCIQVRKIVKGIPYKDNSDAFLKQLILNSHKKIKELAPNAEFIIILYDQKIADMYKPIKIKFDSDRMHSNIWDELEEEDGITVVHTKDVVGFSFDRNYKLKKDIADWHPNAKAWALLTPLFAKKYIK